MKDEEISVLIVLQRAGSLNLQVAAPLERVSFFGADRRDDYRLANNVAVAAKGQSGRKNYQASSGGGIR